MAKDNASKEDGLGNDKPRESQLCSDKVPKKKASKGGTQHRKLGSQSNNFSFDFLKAPCTTELAIGAWHIPNIGGGNSEVKSRRLYRNVADSFRKKHFTNLPED